jgi:hypothetical protein
MLKVLDGGNYDRYQNMTYIFYRMTKWWRQQIYKGGTVLSQFIARDIRRDVKIISTEKINEGLITCQIRTNNILYCAKGLVSEQDYGDPIIIEISKMWIWSGQTWGGLPNGESIVDNSNDKYDR